MKLRKVTESYRKLRKVTDSYGKLRKVTDICGKFRISQFQIVADSSTGAMAGGSHLS